MIVADVEYSSSSIIAETPAVTPSSVLRTNRLPQHCLRRSFSSKTPTRFFTKSEHPGIDWTSNTVVPSACLRVVALNPKTILQLALPDFTIELHQTIPVPEQRHQFEIGPLVPCPFFVYDPTKPPSSALLFFLLVIAPSLPPPPPPPPLSFFHTSHEKSGRSRSSVRLESFAIFVPSSNMERRQMICRHGNEGQQHPARIASDVAEKQQIFSSSSSLLLLGRKER
ncbi:unnamed protein product [Acanthosepion pharaonis]|uniref:Uncharacterized protein n=1 Tax=Acanthosepion pharaonis TaxID=158019 RepID=A0A812ELQ8_ACAPH|nr:unnamed protein product [Sepia pharaonis]